VHFSLPLIACWHVMKCMVGYGNHSKQRPLAVQAVEVLLAVLVLLLVALLSVPLVSIVLGMLAVFTLEEKIKMPILTLTLAAWAWVVSMRSRDCFARVVMTVCPTQHSSSKQSAWMGGVPAPPASVAVPCVIARSTTAHRYCSAPYLSAPAAVVTTLTPTQSRAVCCNVRRLQRRGSGVRAPRGWVGESDPICTRCRVWVRGSSLRHLRAIHPVPVPVPKWGWGWWWCRSVQSTVLFTVPSQHQVFACILHGGSWWWWWWWWW
jgi:hypothetical protein